MGTASADTGQHGHVFRPGPFHRRRALRLDGAVLHWQVGGQRRTLRLADIAAMRLDLAGGAGHAARCVLVERSGRIHRICDRYWPQWTKGERRHWGRRQRHDETFRALTFALARRLAAANPRAIITKGPGRGEWVASCIVAVLALALIIGGVGLMLAQGRYPLSALAFIGMVALYLPLLWSVIRSGGPQPLDPDSLDDAGP